MPVITLTTDFGLRDAYAGVVKGVIYGINPDVKIVDISHEVNQANIKEAAYLLQDSYEYFQKNTVHVCVVDPGVGSGRRAIIVRSEGFLFVGPDNGVFTAFFERADEIISITEKKFLLPLKGPTFHGRDLFAPAAAWLSRGIPPLEFGRPVADPVRTALPGAEIGRGGVIRGEVIHIDRFGNAITNIKGELLNFYGRARGSAPPGPAKGPRLVVRGKTLGMMDYYGQGKTKRKKTPSFLVNSSGLLEIFVYKGSAAKALGIKTGQPVKVSLH